ncbi:MAG: asparaginase [Chloroflexi bacterium]|nr:asparaginase [Chloroflexota bacterium]
MTQDRYVPIFEVTRGETVESIHYGAAVVVDTSGSTIASIGSPQAVAFLRSTAKPMQTLPLFEAGGSSEFKMAQAEIALVCASQSGTDEHVAVLQSLHSKVGITEEHLMCGVHPPYHQPSADALLQRGEEPTPSRHNCSGKHTGMLALARLKGWPTEDYIQPDHPVQKAILNSFAEICDLTLDQVLCGTDGCSAPIFAVPLQNTALGFARLVDPSGLPVARAAACREITSAMIAHPNMVAGPGRFDTHLMQVAGGSIVSKSGSEGYQGIGLMPGALEPGSPALGIAVKISDGDPKGRASSAVSLEILRQLGALSETQLKDLNEFGPIKPIYNWRQLEVGEARPCFTLKRN